MTDAEALEIADITDWWIPSALGPQRMRTLREALAEIGVVGAVSLFRPGGFGTRAIWLSAEDVGRLHVLMSTSVREEAVA